MKLASLLALAIVSSACSKSQESSSQLRDDTSAEPAITMSTAQAAIVAKFDALVDVDAVSDFFLTRGQLVVSARPWELAGHVLLADAQANQGDGEVRSMSFYALTNYDTNGEPISRVDHLVERIFAASPMEVPYFCHRFTGLAGEYLDAAPCKAMTRDLLEAIDTDEQAQVFVSVVEGENYGGYEVVRLYVGRNGESDPVGEFLTLAFDLRHEI